MDFRTLEIVKDTHIDKELTEHFSDIVYRIDIDKRSSYVYALFEHKSYMDQLSLFQLLRNMVKLWERYCRENINVRKLPLIIPIIIYHGRKKWDIGTNIRTLFEMSQEAERYIPDFDAEVFDISHISDEEIQGEVALRMLLLTLKYIFNPGLMDKVGDIFELYNQLVQRKRGSEYLEVLIRYMVSTLDAGNKETLKKKFEETIYTGGNQMPTIAESWKEEGKIEDAKKMILRGMSDEDIHDITDLPMEKIKKLRREENKNR